MTASQKSWCWARSIDGCFTKEGRRTFSFMKKRSDAYTCCHQVRSSLSRSATLSLLCFVLFHFLYAMFCSHFYIDVFLIKLFVSLLCLRGTESTAQCIFDILSDYTLFYFTFLLLITSCCSLFSYSHLSLSHHPFFFTHSNTSPYLTVPYCTAHPYTSVSGATYSVSLPPSSVLVSENFISRVVDANELSAMTSCRLGKITQVRSTLMFPLYLFVPLCLPISSSISFLFQYYFISILFYRSSSIQIPFIQ